MDQENIERSEIIEEKLNEEKEEILPVPENTQEIQEKEIENNEKENVEPAKKPRGRPKGSTKPKKEKPPPPPEKPKVVKSNPKPKKKVVTYESESDEELPLPQYVRQQLPERDLATQMMHLLQQHNNKKADARKQLYSSWFKHY